MVNERNDSDADASDDDVVSEPQPKPSKKKAFVSSEIDAILDKINDEGFHSLTDEEREALDHAQGELKKRDRRL